MNARGRLCFVTALVFNHLEPSLVDGAKFLLHDAVEPMTVVGMKSNCARIATLPDPPSPSFNGSLL